jgi:hypothetical protein
MLSDLPQQLWHSIPISLAAGCIQLLNIVCSFRLFALCKENQLGRRIVAEPLTLIFGMVGF